MRRLAFSILATLLVAITFMTVANKDMWIPDVLPSKAESAGLTELEQQVLTQINGSRAYGYDLELERIALRHFEFRSSGSPGAEESAFWIRDQFESFGINASLEPFRFTSWNLTSEPCLMIDDDGDFNTTEDQVDMLTFTPAHLSYATSPNDVRADLVILPLPAAANRGEIGLNPINETEWAVDTTGRVVLVGKEVRWNGIWLSRLNSKLSMQTPAVLIYTWWYEWMGFTPPIMGSSEGKSYWSLPLPVGFVDYSEGLVIRNRETAFNVSAICSVKSVFGTSTHYNVVGRIGGYKNPEKYVIVSGHYDTVTCSGFCDNGAGTAGVVELANVIADAVRNGTYKPRYTLLFVAFAAEEYMLVGSINYVMQHKNEMPNTVAVINLDCIGSDDFYYTKTEPGPLFDLDQIVEYAARDLSVPTYIIGPGGSDQETFLDPMYANNLYRSYWNLEADISDAPPVSSSILLISQPLFYYDEWNIDNPGWIHTSYDESDSTRTLGWVEVDDLENHIRVAALTILRVSPSPGIPGDIDYNGAVDLYDALLLANAFNSEPDQPNWDANADINGDATVDIYDAIVLATHYGQLDA